MADCAAHPHGDAVVEMIGILADPATSYWLRDATSAPPSATRSTPNATR